MCKLKSGIILKDRVFVPDYDSHTQMLEELGVEDTRRNAESKFVRFEFAPPGGDPFADTDAWVFRVDQDITPDWFVLDYDKTRAVEAVKTWAKNRIYIGINGLELNAGAGYYLKDCADVVLSGDCSVEKLESSTVREMWGSSTVRAMWGSSTVGAMRGSSTVRAMWGSSTVGAMWGSSTVRAMWGSSTVGEMRESSTVREMRESSTAIIAPHYSGGVKPESIILCENATIKDNRTRTIYQSGEWTLVTVDARQV